MTEDVYNDERSAWEPCGMARRSQTETALEFQPYRAQKSARRADVDPASAETDAAWKIFFIEQIIDIQLNGDFRLAHFEFVSAHQIDQRITRHLKVVLVIAFPLAARHQSRAQRQPLQFSVLEPVGISQAAAVDGDVMKAVAGVAAVGSDHVVEIVENETDVPGDFGIDVRTGGLGCFGQPCRKSDTGLFRWGESCFN